MERVVLWHRTLPPTRVEQDVPETVANWIAIVADRLRRAGAVPLGCIGGVAVAAFDLIDINNAINVGLTILDDADENDITTLGISIGIATGDILNNHGVYVGSAIDRAQLLACRARKGELVLDATTRELSSTIFLFGRSVGTGAAALRGVIVDRNVPRRSACRTAIAKLKKPPVAPVTQQALVQLQENIQSGNHCILMRGPSGAGSDEYLDELIDQAKPSTVLRLGSVPGSLEPLGSFRLALLRAFDRKKQIDSELGKVLGSVASGHPIVKEEIASEIKKQLAGCWIILDPIAGVDPSTLSLIAQVRRIYTLFALYPFAS